MHNLRPKTNDISPLQLSPRPLETSTAAEKFGSSPHRYRRRRVYPSSHERLTVKRERNRVAAAKCREKKGVWQKDLERKARTLQSSNLELHFTLGSLKEELLYLKEQIVGYRWYNGTCGCGKDMMSELTVGLWSSRMAASGSSRKGRERERECWEGLCSNSSSDDGEVFDGSSTAENAAENDEDLWNEILC
jgi:hypothetical protein